MIYTNAKTILNTLERKVWWSVKIASLSIIQYGEQNPI